MIQHKHASHLFTIYINFIYYLIKEINIESNLLEFETIGNICDC